MRSLQTKTVSGKQNATLAVSQFGGCLIQSLHFKAGYIIYGLTRLSCSKSFKSFKNAAKTCNFPLLQIWSTQLEIHHFILHYPARHWSQKLGWGIRLSDTVTTVMVPSKSRCTSTAAHQSTVKECGVPGLWICKCEAPHSCKK